MARILLVSTVIALAVAGTVPAQGVDPREPAVTADQVESSIRRGVEYLYSQQNDRGTWENAATPDEAAQKAGGDERNQNGARREFGGHTALAVLALLYCGESPKDPRIDKALKFLAEIEVSGTYVCSIRSSVWSKLNDPKVRRLLKTDAAWLIGAMTKTDGTIPGNFSYISPHPNVHDHSNTQYGVLGLRDAAIRGIEIPPNYWQAIEDNMLSCQADNGGWGYYMAAKDNASHTYGAMTVGCLANVYIAEEMLQLYVEGDYNGRSTKGCGQRKQPEAIDRALAWMDRNLPVDFGLKQGGDPQTWPTTGNHGMGRYYLYALERCASACGRKSFGGVNWFEEGAKLLLRQQDADGGWKASYFGNDIHTSWALLFLSKGQAPVFYNKLDTKADWNNHVRSSPYISQYIADELEQRINWQVIDINDPVDTWLDAPVLMFSGHDIPPFTDEQKKKLRLYTDSGGTILAEACCSKIEFVRGFKALAQEVWPEWELQMLDRQHPVFSFHHQIRGRTPQAMHIDDGCRSRVFLFVSDASGAWNHNMQKAYLTYFQLGMNLGRYASDKRMLRSRVFFEPNLFKELATQGKTVPSSYSSNATVRLGDWPTEGKRLTDIRGLRHLAETLKQAANVTLDVTTFEDNNLDGLDKVQIVHMSGHHGFAVSDENLAKLKTFVQRGGQIWADPQCGREAFKQSFTEFVAKFAPGASLETIAKDDPLVTGSGLPRQGFDVTSVRYKQAVGLEEISTVLKELKIGGKRVLIYSPYDITCGMDGHDCPNCMGPRRNDALKIATNIVLSTPDAIGR
ncbi:MAG: DUF4159 domain-containing protein [Planctomycetes bacterium]|nr:DUF4159 domain-containing protein [Planctomycetota bacterium]